LRLDEGEPTGPRVATVGVAIEPDDTGLLCVHFQPKSERREDRNANEFSNRDLLEGCLIDLRRQRELRSL